MSSASAPQSFPEPSGTPPARPSIVRPGSGGSRRVQWLLAASLLAAVAIVGFLFLKSRAKPNKGGPTTTLVTRTAVAGLGNLDRTVRITGTIQAERFAAIMVPRLHGSHSGRGRGGAGNANLQVATVNTSSLNSGSSSSSASGSSSGISGAPSLNSSSSDSSSGSSSSSSASSSSPSRTSGNRASISSSAGRARSSTGSSTASTEISAASLGSTSGSLMRGGGGGGGGGGSDFSLVLQKVAPGGGRVKKGEVVAEFDRQFQLLRLDDYRDSVVQLDSNIKKLKADLQVAADAHDQLVLVRKSDMSKTHLDLKTRVVRSAIDSERLQLFAEEADAAYKQALEEVKDFKEGQRAQLRAAEIDRDQARIELQRATNNVDRMLLKAPIDGIVVMQSIFRGGDWGQIRAGDQVYSGMLFMSIVDPSSMVVNASINQADSEMLRLGMKARVHLDAYPDLDLSATVIGIGAMTKPGGFRASYVREIPVRLKLDQMDPRVIPDLTASADILLESSPNTVVAPREAVFREAGGEKPFVFVRAGDRWTRREVEVGIENNVAVEVRSGLRKGDVLAVERPQT